MTELTTYQKWENLASFARRLGLSSIRVTDAQRRRIIVLPSGGELEHPYRTADYFSPATLFGLPIEVVPEGFDLWTTVEGAFLGPPRLRLPLR